MAQPNLWGFKKLSSKPWPVAGAAIASPQGQVTFNLKDFLQAETITRLMIRIVGAIAKVGGGAGAATGKDNPEALVVGVSARHTPDLGVISKNALTVRGIIQQGIFDRGYSIHGTPLTDPAGAGPATQDVDYWLPLVFKMPGSVNPIEWALPLALFTNYQLTITCGGREQLFGGGTNTWDQTGLTVELWADYDAGVAGVFHLVEEFEQTVDVLSTKSDLQLILEANYVYTHLLFIGQTAEVLDDTLIEGITVQSAGRIWTPQGEKNAKIIHDWNRETHINNAAEDLSGTYFVPALRDGMASRAIDATVNRVEIKFDVLFAGGPSKIIVRGRRIVPQGLKVTPAAAAV